MKEAEKEIVIIDGYADFNESEIISKLQVKVTLIIKTKSKLSKEEIKKYNSQYNHLTVLKNDNFHDRYFLIDNKNLYHCGTRLNHAGNKPLISTNSKKKKL